MFISQQAGVPLPRPECTNSAFADDFLVRSVETGGQLICFCHRTDCKTVLTVVILPRPWPGGRNVARQFITQCNAAQVIRPTGIQSGVVHSARLRGLGETQYNCARSRSGFDSLCPTYGLLVQVLFGALCQGTVASWCFQKEALNYYIPL
jgi:hypothetical protein